VESAIGRSDFYFNEGNEIAFEKKCTTDFPSVEIRDGQDVRRTTLDFAQDFQHQIARIGLMSIDETEVSGYRTNDLVRWL